MKEFLTTTTGKIAALIVFYVPFLSALFFGYFDGMEFESPIGGCCIPLEGVVAVGYILLTIWIFTPLLLIYIGYRLFRKFFPPAPR